MHTFVVHESPEQLRRLARQYDGAKEYTRILMLLAFREKPSHSNRSVSREIQVPESTVRRWKALYAEQGIEGLVGMGEEDLQHFRALSSAASLSRPLPPASPAKLIDFLNRLPLTANSVQWSAEMKQLLIDTFEEVDNTLVNVRFNINLHNPSSKLSPAIYRQDLFESDRRYVPSMSRERGRLPKWKQLLAQGRKNGFPFAKYHPPVGFDYFYGEGASAYIGTIILLREKQKPPISDETLNLFEQCRPFVASIFFHHVAYGQLEHPGIQLYRDLDKYIHADPPLTSRETEVVSLLMLGHSYEEAADMLFITKSTMISHVRNIYRKTNVTKLSEIFARLFLPRVTTKKNEEDRNRD